MGCTPSKIENDEVISRCKERRKFMKDAVPARRAFSAAHSSYAMALKNTGAALSDFVHGEVHNLNQSNQTASPGPGGSGSVLGLGIPIVVPPPQPPNLMDIPPPPPPPETVAGFSETPLQRAASMPEIKLPQKSKKIEKEKMSDVIIEEADDEEDEIESKERLIRRSRSRKSSKSNRREAAPVQSQHDYAYDYFFPPEDSIPGPNLADVEEIRMEKEKIDSEEMPQRKEEEVVVVEEKAAVAAAEKAVGGTSKGAKKDGSVRGAPASPSAGEKRVMKGSVNLVQKVFEEMPQRKEEVVVVEVEQKEAAAAAEKAVAGASKGAKKEGSVRGAPAPPSAGEKRVMKGSVNLVQVFVELDDCFLSACHSAQEVSKMLEATRLHYHSNFADNRGHIDHSARVMRVISWNRSFRGAMHVDEEKDDFDSEENETHAAILDKLLAWEKKLYDEVKAGELMKIEYGRKVATLNKLKKRNTNSEAVEKAKAAVSHLHTRYIVDMQSLDSTASEINRLRDERLYPKLVQLVDGMATMWETMRVSHETQARIATALKNLNLSQSPKETSDDHHLRTFQLCGVVKDWHSQFCKLVDYQKEYVKALKGWIKLNLVPIENVSSPPRTQNPLIQKLILGWHDQLDKLQDGVAKTAIANFAAVVETIMHHQDDEMKLKAKCEETRKELSRRTRHFEDWHSKYTQRRASGELDRESVESNNAVSERQLGVEVLKMRLADEEEAYRRLCVQVREKSLTTLKLRLPELFRAMSDVAGSFSEMYSNLRAVSQHRSS